MRGKDMTNEEADNELARQLDMALVQWQAWVHTQHDTSAEGSQRSYQKRLRPLKNFATWFRTEYLVHSPTT